MTETLTFSATAEVQATDKRGPIRVEAVLYGGGLMTVGRFGPVVLDLQDIAIPASVPHVTDHDSASRALVGQTFARIEGGKIVARVEIARGTEEGDRIERLAASGIALRFSVGVSPKRTRAVREGDTTTINGRTIPGPHIVVGGTLKETSSVGVPADDDAASTKIAAQSAEGSTSMTDQTIETVRANASAEAERISQIQSRCAGDTELIKAAIADGRSADAAELAYLRANAGKPTSTGRGVSVQPVADVDTLACAAALNTGCAPTRLIAAGVDESTVREAQRSPARRFGGVQSLIRAAARLEGVQLGDTVDNGWVRAAFSTNTVPTLLGDVANKVLIDAMGGQEAWWRTVAKSVPLKDFRPASVAQLDTDGVFAVVGDGGEIQHLGAAENAFANITADLRGSIIGLTLQQIVNDDLQAFASMPRMLGRAAVSALNRLVFTVFLDNAGNFYDASNGNLLAGGGGTDATLSSAGLDAAVALVRKQKNKDGSYSVPAPDRIIVPSALEGTARRLLRSQFLAEGNSTTGDVVGASNAWAGEITPMTAPHIGAGELGAGIGSDSAWYLAGNPDIAASVHVGFLNGQETPYIEALGPDAYPNRVGQWWRVTHAFGAAKGDHRAVVKADGVAAG